MAVMGPFLLEREAIEWRRPPVYLESTSVSEKKYTEAPSG
jgi:hypothetical protein